ncbi:MAG: FMN-dependent NADH-azoreductase [Porticoccaceae bacterium]
MNILKIDTSPRADSSNSRILTDEVVAQLDSTAVKTRDLANNLLPVISAEDLVALHGSQHLDSDSFRRHQRLSDQLIAELKWADTLVIGIAMHNFSVPAVLKQWIDYVCRAGHTFHYTADGPAGLTTIRNAYLVVAAGGTPIGSSVDFASGYLQWICQFIGVKNVHIIDASGSKRAPEEILANGKAQIQALASQAVVA